MTENKVDEILNALKGISYLDWKKLEFCINNTFEAERKEIENEIVLDTDLAKRSMSLLNSIGG